MNEQTLTHPRRSLSELRVMRAMHPGVLACAPDAPVGRVAELMAVTWPPPTSLSRCRSIGPISGSGPGPTELTRSPWRTVAPP